MSLIPDEIIAEIRERVDIVAVIGEHVQLRKAGQNHKGLCPFHHEKTPSFSVNGAKGFFYCFGCQKKGDAFTFLMELEGKSFLEAAQGLAARAGVTIPEAPASPAERRQRSERARMLEINNLAASFYASILADSDRGEAGRRYLEERGVSAETAEHFRLGCAPASWDALAQHLASRKVPVDLAERVGLIAPRQRAGGHYDRFRDRLMCPVILPGGEVVGFSGRRLGEGEPAGAKYINSPESSIYKKSHLLFGLHRAREAFRRQGRAILVEGNFDVISLHQAGFEETVAPLGTALTGEQVEQLRRLASRVVLVYDGDPAGRSACLKALRALLAVGVETLILPLPAGEDPDSLIRNHGKQHFEELLGRAQPAIEYFAYDVWGKNVQTVESRAAVIEEAAELISGIEDPVKKDLITGTLAAGLGNLGVALVRRAAARRGGRHEAPAPPRRPATGPRPPLLELKALAIVADHPELMESAEEQGLGSLLTDARLRDMYSAARQGRPMLSVVPDDLAAWIASHVLAGDYASIKDPAHSLREAIEQLERARSHTATLPGLQREIAEAQRRGDRARALELTQQLITLKRQVD